MSTNQITGSSLLEAIYNNGYYASKVTKKITRSDSDMKSISEDLQSLKKAVKGLQTYNKDVTSTDRMEIKMKKFVTNYNTLTKAESKITDENFTKNMTKLKTLVSDNVYELRKAGIVFNDDGELEVDSDKLEKASSSQLAKLFNGKDSFASLAQTYIKKAYNSAESKITTLSQQKTNVSFDYTVGDYVTAYYAYLLNYDTDLIGQISTNNTDENVTTNANDLDDLFEKYANYYNELINYSQSYTYNYDEELQELHHKDEYSSDLSAIGFSFAEDGTMSYASDSTRFSDASVIESVHKLFDDNSPFGEKVEGLCSSVFKNVIKTNSLGLNVDMYA